MRGVRVGVEIGGEGRVPLGEVREVGRVTDVIDAARGEEERTGRGRRRRGWRVIDVMEVTSSCLSLLDLQSIAVMLFNDLFCFHLLLLPLSLTVLFLLHLQSSLHPFTVRGGQSVGRGKVEGSQTGLKDSSSS
jgi:hypothetical protein